MLPRSEKQNLPGTISTTLGVLETELGGSSRKLSVRSVLSFRQFTRARREILHLNVALAFLRRETGREKEFGSSCFHLHGALT